MRNNQWLQGIVLLSFLGVACWIYWPGINGKFIFDDYHNLEAMGYWGGVRDWETAKAFIFSGISGPTGRPLALASFLLNDQTWPSQAESFKYTNLLIHLLVGLGVFWSFLNLLRLFTYPESEAEWIALVGMGLWLLHPYFVSTTLYVIQRMTQLAALFSIFGVAAYLNGRKWIPVSPVRGYLWMSIGVVLGGLLAVFSKENGVLLPTLLLSIEICMPRGMQGDKYFTRWATFFLWIPSLVIIVYLSGQINFSPDAWPTRSFNQLERLLTEPRILVEYLYDLLVPKFEGMGLYQDGIRPSRGLFDPPSTLPSVLAIVFLFSGAFWLRRKYPLFAIAVFFYFAGHLLESTVIGLELYFEHRNYLPSVFIFLFLSDLFFCLRKYVSRGFLVALLFIVFGALSFLTWQRTTLWRGGYNLTAYWAHKNPDSPRAQNGLAHILIESGRADEALDLLQKASARLPESALLTTSLLCLQVANGSVQEKDFRFAASRLAVQSFDAQAVKGIYALVDFVTSPGVDKKYAVYTLDVLSGMSENNRYSKFPMFQRFLPYQRGRLLLHLDRADEAFQDFMVALRLYGDINSSLEIVSQMANYHQFALALKLLDQAELIFGHQSGTALPIDRKFYEGEISRIRQALKEDLSNVK